MKNKRNSLAILCMSAFALSLVLTGCNSKNKSTSTSSGGSGTSSSQRTGDTFIVHFDTGHGSKVEDQTVKKGEKATKPADPTYDGYNFVGWFEDSVCVTEFDFDTAITADWTIYAGWKLDNEGGGPGPIVGDKTYTCTDLPDWITNDGCVIFVWAWEAGQDGSWVSANYTSTTSLEFVVPNELQGFLLARCISGTTQPNWDIHDDSVGRIYNQTEDIACSSGVYSYACAQWKEYK